MSNHSSAQIETTEIEGKWMSNCYKLPKRHSVQTQLIFKNSKCNVISTLFADNECKIKNLNIHYDTAYEISNSFGEGEKFNYTPENIYLTIINPDVVEHYNKNFEAGCEISDWKLNETRDVSGKNCAGNKMYVKNLKIFDLYTKHKDI